MADVIAFNKANADKALRFGQDLFLAAQATQGDLSELEYTLRARDGSAGRQGARHGRLHDRSTSSTRWCFPAHAAPRSRPRRAIPACRCRAASSPASADKETPDYPLGITFAGRAWSEAKLLRLAYAYEQASNARRPPRGLRPRCM